MKKHFLNLFFIIFSAPLTYAQLDSLVVDSLEVAEAEEEIMYKEDTADFVYYSLPADLEYIPGDDHPALHLQRRLRYKLHCIIDTAGKSLHGWFDAPRNKLFENRLKTGLTAFGCDPKVFTYSQPVRVPGAYRDGKLQRLVWLRD